MGERSGKFDLVTLQGDSDHLPSLATLQSGQYSTVQYSIVQYSTGQRPPAQPRHAAVRCQELVCLILVLQTNLGEVGSCIFMEKAHTWAFSWSEP